ncbi:Predicted dehydrogenase [Salinibacillus kushneri]|uniref:Predicted dehydrogenase n=1 Tax=Salinibacillus kushneri TaxID=237682 RepID=A0A1I0AFT6_9BACI|nr:Gfo/Idh/MocA family oxidoreductase [Salinibacillus kushneri]SES93124.1 Predicted dehydrogenase [Salinibacillus kushneri]
MKVGVIGTGNMGENHVKTYLSMRDHCKLVGIYDRDEEKTQRIAKKYKVKKFQSLPNLLESVDAVSIAVPTELHYDIGLLCVKHHVHMLMEKPITDTLENAEHLISEASQAGVKLQVGHIELFNPLIQILSQELKNEKIIGVDFHRMSPYDEKIKDVDVVKDLMIHDLYLVRELLQDEMIDFYTLGKIIENTPKYATVIAKSSKGVIAQLTASFKSQRKIRRISILTENALIEADILAGRIILSNHYITKTIAFDNEIQPLKLQLIDFIDCIKSDKNPSVSGVDGLIALQISQEISEAIYQH